MQASPATQDITIPDRIRPGIVAVLMVTVVVATLATYFGVLRLFETQAVSVARSQHALYLRALNETLQQHQHLPYILSRNPDLTERVAGGDIRALNVTLEDFAQTSGLEAIYIMSPAGEVVATSNYNSVGSFLGKNYGFRPYFQGALTGTRSDYFAIGATTGRPGYFVAEPLYDANDTTIGVVAIKLDISELQSSWTRRGENVLATNADGIVVLSSNPAWLYGTIPALDPVRKTEITQSRQFAGLPLAPLPWQPIDAGRVTLAGEPYFLTTGTTDMLGWSVHYLTLEAGVQRQTLLATGVVGAVLAILIGFAAFLRSRRIETALQLSQYHRRELIEANGRLLTAQDELARSSKLAALGQLAASVTHELGQPISALKNHLAAAELGGEIKSPATLENLSRLTTRMEDITKELRFFAQRNPDAMQPTDLHAVLREALGLVRHDFDAEGITVDMTGLDSPCAVFGNQMQLEQAMVNLLRNAYLASLETGEKTITLTCTQDATQAQIVLCDQGPGLGGRSLDALQEPFFSTRSSGMGMGLGLAITSEIVRAHAGTLTAADGPLGGACFTLTLPKDGAPAP